MTRFLKWTALVAVLSTVLLALGGGPATGAKGSILKRAALGQLKPAYLTIKVRRHGRVVKVRRRLPSISAGTINSIRTALGKSGYVSRSERIHPFLVIPSGGDADERRVAADANAGGGPYNSGPNGAGLGIRLNTYGCSGRVGNGKGDSHEGDNDANGHGGKNVRVNQDCTFRRQAEEEMVYSPADPKNLLAGQNDSRVGYNQCGIDFSLNNGGNWGDMLPPFRQRDNEPDTMGPSADNPNNNTILGGQGTVHTYDAASDPALAADSSGRSYFSCVTFDIASFASGLFVTQSPKGAKGSYYFNVPAPPAKAFMVVEDNNIGVAHDKNFIASDGYKNSPNRDNVYVTWTVFRFDQTTGQFQQAPIYGSMSTDHGVTWSTPEDISGSSDALCFFGDAFDPSLSPHKCDFDQGSDPVVLPNGDLEVVFNNGNTPAGNPNGQQLAVHCKPTGSSTDGTAQLNCASPAKVGDDIIAGEPQCDFGRGPEECIPGAYIRTNDFPRINTQNTQNGHLYSTWQDYRNGEFDIQESVSTDGGLTWHEVGTVNPDRGLDHYFPADDRTPSSNGDHVGVSYYRTERVPNENTTPSGGFAPGTDPGVQDRNSDYVLAGGSGASLPYAYDVISPVFPPPDGIQSGFNGDYSGLAINDNNSAHPIWSDTRNVDPYAPANGVIHDEDVFTDNVGLPNGGCSLHTGKVGKSHCGGHDH